jgi:peroxiredoxin
VTKPIIRILATALGALLIAAAAPARPDSTLTLDPKGAVTARFGYFPVQIALSTTKPPQVKKEPTYVGTPKYAIIRLGNGPNNDYVIALDEPQNGEWKIYIDKNRNGDLTDDGDGAWNKKSDRGGRVMYGVMDVTLRASYGSPHHERSSGDYTIGLYRFAGMGTLIMYRESARTGDVELDGKVHKAVLVENDGDALFDKHASSMQDAAKTKPVWLKVDVNDDGKYASGIVDVRAPFKIGDKAYEAKIAADGSRIKLTPTTKPVVDLTPKPPPPPPLLKSGAPAPDFTAKKWGGGDLKLSDYKGKVVVLDFWATWCGPCQKSMPHIETVNKAVQGQDVVVVGVCVWDAEDAYAKWVPENQSKYTFQFAFDPAGRDSKTSIASKLFQVSGIPTTYIIDKDGKVADAIVGYDDGDKRVEEALKKLGVKVD